MQVYFSLKNLVISTPIASAILPRIAIVKCLFLFLLSISVIYCLVYKRKYWLAITINFVSLIAYFPFLDNLYVFDFGIVAFIYLLVIMYFIYVTFKGVLNIENINRKKVKNG